MNGGQDTPTKVLSLLPDACVVGKRIKLPFAGELFVGGGPMLFAWNLHLQYIY